MEKGIYLASRGQLNSAVEVLQNGLSNATKNEDKGSFLYNIASCQARQEQDQQSIYSLYQALKYSPKLISILKKDVDFMRLAKYDSYLNLLEKYKWCHIEEWKLFALFILISSSTFVITIWLNYPNPKSLLVGLNLFFYFLAWFLVRFTEKFFRGLKEGIEEDIPYSIQADVNTPQEKHGDLTTCPNCGHSWIGNWQSDFKNRQCPQCGNIWSVS